MVMKSVARLSIEILPLVDVRTLATNNDSGRPWHGQRGVNGVKAARADRAFFWNLAASADSIRAREYDSPIVCPGFGNRACELRRRARTLTYRCSSPPDAANDIALTHP